MLKEEDTDNEIEIIEEVADDTESEEVMPKKRNQVSRKNVCVC